MRLDRAFAARGLARSRTHAQALIAAGHVTLNGAVATRAAAEVADGDVLALAPDADHYVSRGAHKLIGALDDFTSHGLRVGGRRCLDAGASTGGFTQVLLERGAARVLALDVGHGQLAPPLANDPRIEAREGVNVRDLPPPRSEEEPADLVVADLSFISLKLVVPALAAWVGADGDALLLVKPQFEVGADRVGRGGVVRSPEAMIDAVGGVAAAMSRAGLGIAGVARSRLSGPRGTVEFFLWGRRTWQAWGGPGPLEAAPLERAVEREVRGGA